MVRVSVQRMGTNVKNIIREWDKLWIDIQNDIFDLGKDIHLYMISYIQAHKKRPQAEFPTTLENAIKLVDLSGMGKGGFGIGEIEKLNREAPYWRFVNYGIALSGTTIPGRGKRVPPGFFNPGIAIPSIGDFRSGRWKKGWNSEYGRNYSFKSKNPMPAMNYIEATGQYTDLMFDFLISDIEKRFGELE